MTEIVETGYGKINLALAITGAREDGYHNIDTIFQSIGLCDTVTLREAEEDVYKRQVQCFLKNMCTIRMKRALNFYSLI